MEASNIAPIRIWCYSLNCSLSWVSFFHWYIVGFCAVWPFFEQNYMLWVTVNCISSGKLIFANVAGNCMHGEGGQSWFSKLPSHWDKAWTVSSVSIMSSSLVVRNMFVNPILTTCNDSASSNTSQTILGKIWLLADRSWS
jgi:hypothetical protein